MPLWSALAPVTSALDYRAMWWSASVCALMCRPWILCAASRDWSFEKTVNGQGNRHFLVRDSERRKEVPHEWRLIGIPSHETDLTVRVLVVVGLRCLPAIPATLVIRPFICRGWIGVAAGVRRLPVACIISIVHSVTEEIGL